jgi:excisionase family DNA binding protein
MLTPLYRAEQVAEILQVSKPYVYQLIREDKIPSIKMGKSVRVRPSDLEAFIEASLTAGENVPFGLKRSQLPS